MILEFSELATWRKKRNVICDARMCPSPSLEQAKLTLSACLSWTSKTQRESISYRSRLPAELALQLRPAETKYESVVSLYINAVLTIKL